jgi:hypothetical protein
MSELFPTCPRCGQAADHSPDEKQCSDNCIMRLNATLARVAEACDWQMNCYQRDSDYHNGRRHATEDIRAALSAANRIRLQAEAGEDASDTILAAVEADRLRLREAILQKAEALDNEAESLKHYLGEQVRRSAYHHLADELRELLAALSASSPAASPAHEKMP